MKHILLRVLLVLVAAWLLFVGALYAAMTRTPAEFSRFMMHVPMPLMFVAPFPPMWAHARAGVLKIGDPAPDFDLKRQNAPDRIRLSQFRGSRPVVLIFGSYT